MAKSSDPKREAAKGAVKELLEEILVEKRDEWEKKKKEDEDEDSPWDFLFGK